MGHLVERIFPQVMYTAFKSILSQSSDLFNDLINYLYCLIINSVVFLTLFVFI